MRSLPPWCTAIPVLFLCFTSACGSDSTTNPQPRQPGPEVSTLKFMTYNIRRTGRAEEPERLPLVMDVIKAHAPDVIGLEEANLWEDGDPPLVDSVANALGMNAAYAPYWAPECDPPPCGSGQIVLTRFTIVRFEALYRPIAERHPILKTVLVDDDGRPWIVYVAHLRGTDRPLEERLIERAFVRDNLIASDDTLSVALGDWNLPYDEMAEYLPGWQCIAYNTRMSVIYHGSNTSPIDQIWLSGDMDDIVTHGAQDLYWGGLGETMDLASDHHPVMVMVTLRKP